VQIRLLLPTRPSAKIETFPRTVAVTIDFDRHSGAASRERDLPSPLESSSLGKSSAQDRHGDTPSTCQTCPRPQ
jgi:hypothetical protein